MGGLRQLRLGAGRPVVALATHVGGVCLTLWRLLAALRRRRLDRAELLRAMHSFGNASLPLTLVTATFMGLTLVLQSAFYVQQFGAHDLIGWFAGYSILRELGPVVLGLMLSGRVGANNTAELATLCATERLDALRILAVDVHAWLLLPRTLAMMVAQVALLMLANVVALSAGALAAWALLGIELLAFYHSVTQRLGTTDLFIGVAKACLFGLVVAVVSTYFGLRHRGGATEVGGAVRQQVVACALCLFAADYVMSVLSLGL